MKYCSNYLPFSTKLSHACPGSDNDGAWSTSGDASGGIDASVPSGVAVELVLSESLGSEHKNGATFWTISILVWITRNGGNTGHSEIVSICELVAELFDKWVNVGSKAAIRMASNSVALGKCSDLLSWVVVSEGVLWAGGHQANNV